MANATIAIIGLGNVGTVFLKHFIDRDDLGLRIACVAEPLETEGKKIAQDKCIAILKHDEIVGLGDDIDFIFNLTRDPKMQAFLQKQLFETTNLKTEVVSERILKVVWSVMTDSRYPFI